MTDFLALDVSPEVSRSFPQASTRFSPTIPEVFRGSRAETLLEKNKKRSVPSLLSSNTLRPSIIVQGGLITHTGVVLMVLVLVFVVPGAVF